MERSEVLKVATLSRMTLTEDELVTFGKQLTEIFEYVKLLDGVNLDGVEPMVHAIDLQNVFREDCRTDSLDRAEALGNSPKTDGKYFLVPRILEEKTGG